MQKRETSRRKFIETLGKGASGLAVANGWGLFSCSKHTQKPPNIVLIFIDDQGYADLGCFGAKDFKTPNIDRLATEGMRFTDFHVSQAVCSASRAALMTGCYSERVGIRGALNPYAQYGLNPEETTIADMLKRTGYTSAIVGKWHLGHRKEFLPLQQGFDQYYGIPYSNDMWPVDYDGQPHKNHRKNFFPALPLIENNEKVGEINTLEDQATITTKYTEKSIQFIEENRDKPFFLYLAHTMVHVPLGVSEKFRGKSAQGMYGDVMMEVDWSVGEVMKTLEKNDLTDNTLVIYTSDNGPWINYGNHAGLATPLREGKGTAFEGGPRVPCVMRWPGHIPANSECNHLAASIDILPTLSAITGAPLPEKKIDGVNILSLMKGDSQTNPREQFYYYYGEELRAVRENEWKLYFPHKSRSYLGVEPGKDGYPGPMATVETGLELYNLDIDISETKDVAALNPEVVKRLEKIGDEARRDLGDKLTDVQGSGIRKAGRIEAQQVSVKHLAVGKSISLLTAYMSRFSGGGEKALVDGFRGTSDFTDGFWQGYEKNDVEAVIDLGKLQKVKKITCGFLESQYVRIFFPSEVIFAISRDGRSFKKIQSISSPESRFNPKPRTKDFSIDFNTHSARYIKIYAKNIGKCPSWYYNSDHLAWLFIDEIIVE
jgi:arylsulfatase